MSATTHGARPVPAPATHVTSRARELAAEVHRSAAVGRFTPGLLEFHPEPARRWLKRVIDLGTPLYTGALVRMHGEINLGHWHAFEAVQTLVPGSGFVWSARTHVGHLPVRGFDALVDAVGRQEWHVLGLPLLTAKGPDDSRSAADRLAADAVLVPTTLVDASWRGYPHDTDAASYSLPVHGRYSRPRVRIQVDQDGRLELVRMQRWGELPSGGYGSRTFYVDFADEFPAAGLRMPDGIRAAWYDDRGCRQEFFRARLDAVELRADGAA